MEVCAQPAERRNRGDAVPELGLVSHSIQCPQERPTGAQTDAGVIDQSKELSALVMDEWDDGGDLDR